MSAVYNVLMLLAAVLLPVVVAQAPVNLKYLPPVGKAIRYKMVMDMQQGMGAMGTMKSKTTVDMTIKAISRSGDVTTLETKTENAKVTIPAGSPMASMKDMMEKQMSGKTATVKMDSHYQGVGSTDGMLSSLNSGPGGAMSGMSLPNHPVKVGDSWSSSLDIGKAAKGASMGGMTMKGNLPIKMKLLSVSGGQAKIAMTITGTMTMAMPAGGTTSKAQNIATKMNVAGTYSINVSDGTLVNSTMTSDSTTDMGKMIMKQHMVQSMTRQ